MSHEQERMPYRKPMIERVNLLGEESAAVPNCKRSNGGGKNRSFPNPCRITGGAPVRCFDARGS